MKIDKTARGFQTLMHPIYPPSDSPVEMPILQTSPLFKQTDEDRRNNQIGMPCIWVGNTFLLDHEQAAYLRDYLDKWLDTGKLD